MIETSEIYHTGFVVANLEAAMKELTTVFGVRWTDIEDRPMKVVTPEGPTEGRLRFTYSIGDAPHLELLEAVEGTAWDQPAAPGSGLGAAHHVGVWTENFADTSDRMVEAGFPRELTYNDGSGRAANFAYHRLPSGALVELVDTARRPQLEAWLKGGPYPAAK